MLSINVFENYHPSGDFTCLLICIAIVISLKASYIKSSKNFRTFKLCNYTLIFSMCYNMACYICYHLELVDKTILAFMVRFIFSIYVWLLNIYVVYIIELLMLRDEKRITSAVSIINAIACMGPFLVPDAVVVSNGELIANMGKFLFPLFYVSNIVLALYFILRHRNLLLNQFVKVLSIIAVMSLLVAVVGFRILGNSCIGISFLLPMIVVLLMTHSNAYDSKTGALDFQSFSDELDHLEGKKANLLCLQLNVDNNYEIPNELGRDFRNFWGDYFKDAVLFHPTTNLFVLKINDTGDITGKIRDIIKILFPKYHKKYQIEYKIVALQEIDFIQSYSEFGNVLDYFLQNIEKNSAGHYHEADYENVRKINAISGALKQIYNTYDLNDKRVLAYCQPIKNSRTNQFETAEALMRLELPGLGFLNPNDFVYLLEKNNYIHRFTMIMLHKICQYLKETEAIEGGIKRITLNCSIQELRDPQFLDDFKAIVEKNQVPYEKIGVEFTESMDELSWNELKDVVKQIQQLGCKVYLDDFGTGYSNFNRLLHLNIDVIKFDRSFLLEADKQEHAKHLIKALSDAFEKMQFYVLFEGVETREHEALCKSCNAEYLQGFRYSKPIPITELQGFMEGRCEE